MEGLIMSIFDKGLNSFVWNLIFGGDSIKRKQFDEVSIYHNSGSIKDLAFKILSPLRLGIIAKNSEKRNELYKCDTINIAQFKKYIDSADVVSFDIFDTLLLRPISKANDLYYFLELQNNIFDFRRLRIESEIQARNISKKNYGEINIFDIYDRFDCLHQCDVDDMAHMEMDIEKAICFKREQAFELYSYARSNNKTVICTSDMYLPSAFLNELLLLNGIRVDKIFVSCEEGCNKSDGSLQKVILNFYKNKTILHIGDDYEKDIKQSLRVGFNAVYLKNVNELGHKYRAYIDHSFIGSVYSGIVNSVIYGQNISNWTVYKRYGFIYGGILTLGFCQWLNRLTENNSFEKIIFLGRDCKIIKEIFEEYYNNKILTDYLEISRAAFIPFLVNNSYDLFISDAFGKRKNLGKKLKDIFTEINLNVTVENLFEEKYSSEDILNGHNYLDIRKLLIEKQEIVRNVYSEHYKAFKVYVDSFIGSEKKVCIIDLGWRGSSIAYLMEYYKTCYATKIYGALFGMTDSSVTQINDAGGKIFSFLFSPSHSSAFGYVGGEDLTCSDYRFMLEFMYTSTENSVLGYKLSEGGVSIVREERDTKNNNFMIEEIHNGIRYFAYRYKNILGSLFDHVYINSNVSFIPLLNLMNNIKPSKLFKNFSESDETIHGYSMEKR